MHLPVMPPVKPMLAKACELDDPELLKWIAQESVGFEPKWDTLCSRGAPGRVSRVLSMTQYCRDGVCGCRG
jgi:hypothetical protein